MSQADRARLASEQMGMGGNDFFESMMSDLLHANDRVTQAKLKALEERNAQLESQPGLYENMDDEDNDDLYDQVPVQDEGEDGGDYDNAEGGFIDYTEPDQLEAGDNDYDVVATAVPEDGMYGDPSQLREDEGSDEDGFGGDEDQASDIGGDASDAEAAEHDGDASSQASNADRGEQGEVDGSDESMSGDDDEYDE